MVCSCEITPAGGPNQSDTVRAPDVVVAAAEAREAGDLEEALLLLEQAIEANPTLTDAYLARGDLYEEQGDLNAAERDFRKAAATEPRNFDAQFKLGSVLQALNRVREAVRVYLRAIAIRPDDRDANMKLGTAYVELGEERQALPYAEKAVELDPAHGPSRANLAAVYAGLGRHADAVRQYEAALELMDLTPELLLGLAESLGKTERYEEMANTLETAVRVGASEAAYERLGFARFKLRQYRASADAFRASLEFDPNYFPALNGLGIVLLNDYLLGGEREPRTRDEALDLLRQSLRVRPGQDRIVGLLDRFG